MSSRVTRQTQFRILAGLSGKLGRRRSVRARPGGVWSGVPFRPEPERSARSLSDEPSGRGVLTRSRSEAPGGRKGSDPSGPRERFQPAPGAPCRASAKGVPGGPDLASTRAVPEGPLRSARPHRALDDRRRARPARPPPPPVRSPAGRPPQERGEEKNTGGLGRDASIFDRDAGWGG